MTNSSDAGWDSDRSKKQPLVRVTLTDQFLQCRLCPLQWAAHSSCWQWPLQSPSRWRVLSCSSHPPHWYELRLHASAPQHSIITGTFSLEHMAKLCIKHCLRPVPDASCSSTDRFLPGQTCQDKVCWLSMWLLWVHVCA